MRNDQQQSVTFPEIDIVNNAKLRQNFEKKEFFRNKE